MSGVSALQLRSRNPFLPKAPAVRWRKGPFAPKGTTSCGLEIVPRPSTGEDRSKTESSVITDNAAPVVTAPCEQAYPQAGRLSFDYGAAQAESCTGWGTNLDMIPLAHGPVGCGTFGQTSRLNMPGFLQGIESFTALDFATNFRDSDFEDKDNGRLAAAIDEAIALFPLTRGVAVIREDPLAALDTDIKGVTKAKSLQTNRLIVPLPNTDAGTAAALRQAAKSGRSTDATNYNVAVPFYRPAAGLVWIVAKLLREIGLDPILEFTGSSSSDMARLGTCKIAISFFDNPNDPPDSHRGNPKRLREWYGLPLVPTCFLGPSATSLSLRAIASHFNKIIQRKAESTIESNEQKIEALVSQYRPKLEGKLVLLLHGIPKTQLEIFERLGLRVGFCRGWPGKRGVWRSPRLVIKHDDMTEKALSSYIAEAKPDFIYHVDYDENDWHKRGLPSLPFSPFMDHGRNLCWGYDGFACFSAALDRHLNAPWRDLLESPWPEESG
jgi:nitrogenase molybdenum-iron protein alpha chain